MLLNHGAVPTPGEKIAIARNAKKPVWSQAHLADRLDGSLGLSSRQWLDRIKNLEGERTKPRSDYMTAIADAMGVDRNWMAVEGPGPVRWTASNASFLNTPKSTLRQIPYLGYVPAFGVAWPSEELEVENQVSTSYRGDEDVFAVKLRGKALQPPYRPGTQFVVVRGSAPVPDVLNLALSEEGKLLLGQIRRDGQRWMMDFSNPSEESVDVSDWRFLGHVAAMEYEAPEGLTL